MVDPKYLRDRAAKCEAIAEMIADVPAKAALLELATDFKRWAYEIEDGEPSKTDGGL
jgi:hypothetical protein